MDLDSPRCRGFSLVEVLIAMAIFSVLMGGVYGAFNSQLQHFTQEYRIAETDVEYLIAKNVIERDIQLAGYGLAEDFSDVAGIFPVPDRPIMMASGGTTASDTFRLFGSALGFNSRQSQEWSYRLASGYGTVGDVREDLDDGVRVIVMEANTKRLLQGSDLGNSDWLFKFDKDNDRLLAVGSGSVFDPPPGSLVYGLHDKDSSAAERPYYTVRYSLGGDPDGCAPGAVQSLLRAESRSTENPSSNARPLLDCVLDMEIGFWLDTNNDDVPDTVDNGAVSASYTAREFRERLRQVRVFLLVQASGREQGYSYPQTNVLVGDADGFGRTIALTEEQRKYRWRLIAINVTPRNLR